MLLRFRFSNFRCFRDSAELSLIADRRLTDGYGAMKPDGLREQVLCVAGIYGPNASGKSSVLDALSFLQRAVAQSYRSWPVQGPLPLERFLFDERGANSPLDLEIDFLLAGQRLRYAVSLAADSVLEEHLLAWPEGHQQTWMQRQGQDFRFSRQLKGRNRSLAALTRPTALFLSVAAEHGHEQLSAVHQGLLQGVLPMATPDNERSRSKFTARMLSRDEHRAEVEALLQEADLGITDVMVEERDLPTDVRVRVSELLSGDRAQTPDSNVTRLLDDMRLLDVSFGHRYRGAEGRLPLEAESRGTQAWFALAGPVVSALSKGTTLVVDELQASLHPLLAAEAVRLFNDPARNPRGAQLLFTGHDTTLLGHALERGPALRRDQIWFTERGADGAANLYPLTDFKPRKGENVERGYLQGRYGAVPFLDDLAAWRPAQETAHGEE